ncbi:MAG: hydroxymyristoyl-ACP dehydratase [Gammaproteobacteria bacterium]
MTAIAPCFETHSVIDADHPSLPGHFPGAPIVPGVVILDEVAAALTKWRAGARIVGMPVVKFTARLRPQQPYTISLVTRGDDVCRVDFLCRAEGRTVAKGRLEIA